MEVDLDRLHQIFDAVAEMSPGEERSKRVAELSEGNESLQAEVEALLSSSEEEGGFMSAPEVSPDDAEFLLSPDLKEGAVIGKYRLLEQIGEGANAIVYMVEQSKPFRRRAALKVLKAGMDTREVIARFEGERQALAMMDHPNIAKVLDAGATSSGRPYFVMELVKGIPITEYCDLNCLDTRERLELFILVCQAISHAHLKGIIHRDIKPTNVLVTLHDGEPVPKVIDFGIAKATGPNFTDRTLFTRFHQFIGTPAYMSPEQAEMSGLDVDTRSDVYSLGVLLYELLTGSTPFDGKEMLESGVSELQRVIRDSHPETPSTRLNTLSAEGLTAVAKSRRIKPGELSNDIAGDLDWIVMKTLEKDRVRRYETVGELMRDVRRHLDNEPVEAGPPSRLYRMGKFVRRNRTMVVAVSLVTVSLIAALLIASFGLVQAKKDAAVARREAEKAATVVGLMDEMFSAASPDAEKGKDLLVTELLDDFSGRIVDQLSSEPEVELTLRRTVGIAYDGLGESIRAENHLHRAFELAVQIHGPESIEAAELRSRRAWVVFQLSSPDRAIDELNDAMDVQREKLDEGDPDFLRTMSYLAAIYQKLGKSEQARELAEKVLAKATEANFPDLPWVQQSLAEAYRDLGEGDKADALASQISTAVKETNDYQRPRTLGALCAVVQNQIKFKKLKEAGELLKVGLGSAERTLESDHRITLRLRVCVGDLAKARSDSETALRIYQELHGLQKEALGPHDVDTVETMIKVSATSLEQGDLDRAKDVALDALEAATREQGDTHEQTFRSAIELAKALNEKGKFLSARDVLNSHHEMALTSLRPDSEVLFNLKLALADTWNNLDKPISAEKLSRAALSQAVDLCGADDPRTLSVMHKLAEFLESEQRYGEAIELTGEIARLRGSVKDLENHAHYLRERKLIGPALEFYQRAYEKAVKENGPFDELSFHARHYICQCHLLLGRRDQGLALFEEGKNEAGIHLGAESHKFRWFDGVINSDNKYRKLDIENSAKAEAGFEQTKRANGATSIEALEKWRTWIILLFKSDAEKARLEADKLLQVVRGIFEKEDRMVFEARLLEARAASHLGEDDKAEELFRSAFQDVSEWLPDDDKAVKAVIDQFAMFMLHRGRRSDFNETVDAWQDEVTDSDWDGQKTEELLPRGSQWWFLNYEKDEKAVWKEFGDERIATAARTSWKTGRAPFGYGYGNAVVIGEATSPLREKGKLTHTTFYFRKAFQVENPEEISALKIRLLQEDGAAVYLNGKEVVRDNLAPGARFDTPATTRAWNFQRHTYRVHLADPSLLRAGQNIIAVEVHQDRTNSDDMAFDLQLTALLKESTQ